MSGDKLIKPGSLSGNRLRNRTVTGKQIDLVKLGKVPNARQADNAPNAAELGGKAPSAYAAAGLLGSPAPVAAGGSYDETGCILGEVTLLAGNLAPANWHLADGSLLSISANVALWQLLGTAYGGNGTTNFALPDLRAAAPKGAGPHGVNYYICTTGTYP